ncbi:adenylate cyclase type 4-like [Watersipora subatra]|uniref:adenylate cyclase type 4-like n=1 Tax=Watersipora subatra TaxID=2589382 RepID=UPI00355C994C
MIERLNEETGGQSNSTAAKRLWHDFYVRGHKQVSILFADLVNFTDLTTKCSAKDLVTMLNEIYGKFDGIASLRVAGCYHYLFSPVILWLDSLLTTMQIDQ